MSPAMLSLFRVLRAGAPLVVLLAGGAKLRDLRRRSRGATGGEPDEVEDRLDLEGVDLRRTGLPDDELRGARLNRARASGCDLEGRDLTGADLTGAKLDRANLQGVDLSRAVLAWADLRHADLRHATLAGASLVEAELMGADLRGADLSRTGHLVTAHLRGARADGATRWPPGFDPVTAGVSLVRSAGRDPFDPTATVDAIEADIEGSQAQAQG